MNTGTSTINGNGTRAADRSETFEASDDLNVRKLDDTSAGYDMLTPTTVHLRSSAYDDGYEVARKSNDFRPNPETQEKLRQKWQKVARESDQGAFDTSANLHDKHYQEEFVRLRDIRRDAEDSTHHAEINLREKEETLAQTPKPEGESNGTFWLVFVVAVLVFSIGFAPTFHDIFFIDLAATDPLLSWIASAGVSIPIGAILALLILVEFGRKIVSFNWLGVAAGILVALGFLTMRVSASGELDALSVGLTIYEIALVLGLEAMAYFRRKARKEAFDVATTYEKAWNDLEIALGQKERSRQDYEKIDCAIKRHIEYIEQRITGTQFNSAIQEALVSAALDGYNAGIEDNHGRRIGRRDKIK